MVDVAGERIEIDSPACCWVIRRREFDAMLLDAARARGIEVRESVKLRDARRDGDHIVLETDAGPIRARAVVGADGSGSLVRRRLVSGTEGWLARAVDVRRADRERARCRPASSSTFAPVLDGLAGYAWSFPCLIEGRPHWNVGVYSLARRGEGERLSRLLDERAGAPEAARKAHPIRLYGGREPISAPGVLLAGDAAGVDPLLGEGISFALQFGLLAARTLAEGFAAGDLRFAAYARHGPALGHGQEVASSGIGREAHVRAPRAGLLPDCAPQPPCADNRYELVQRGGTLRYGRPARADRQRVQR